MSITKGIKELFKRSAPKADPKKRAAPKKRVDKNSFSEEFKYAEKQDRIKAESLEKEMRKKASEKELKDFEKRHPEIKNLDAATKKELLNIIKKPEPAKKMMRGGAVKKYSRGGSRQK